MLLWAGFVLIAGGIVCIGFDRSSSRALYDLVGIGFWKFLDATTHWAKASHWLIAAFLAYGAASYWNWELVRLCAKAFIESLLAGSIVLHTIKLVLGRRRPRDDIEMNLYGFKPLAFSTQYNSFPSGHALTIMCVAVIASAVWPGAAILWFAVALWLGLTRALLTAHYLSDVFVGAGIGLISAREAVMHILPNVPTWF
jgi:membrane-associated phospholipid phosphatase